MPRISKIRWRDKDVKEFQRLVRNFNAKIDRAKKRNPDTAGALPEKLSVKGLQAKIQTRAEFNRQKTTFKRFSKRGSEDVITTKGGVELTKFELAEIKNKTRIVNIKRAQKKKKLDLTAEKGVETQVANLGLQPKVFKETMTKEEMQKAVESLDRQLDKFDNELLLEQYKANYIKGIKQLGVREDDLLKKIEGLDAQELFDLTVANAKLEIDFYYDDEQEAGTIAENIIEEWDHVL